MPIFGNLAAARAAQLNGRREGEERQRRSLLEQIAEQERKASSAREAEMFGLQKQKMERDLAARDPWSLVETEGGYVQVDPRSGNTRPVLMDGKPVRKPNPRQLVKGRGADGQPEAEDGPNWQIVQTDDGVVQVNPKTGASRPVMAPAGGAPLRGKRDPEIGRKARENRANLAKIDAAIAELERHPEAVGHRRGWPLIGNKADEFFNPEGTDARASVSDVGSMVVHQRAGASQTASETKRIAPFVPSVDDQSASAIKKLRRMRALLESETVAMESEGGVESAPASGFRPTNPFAPKR